MGVAVVESNTSRSTVQEDCINKSLTRKCLVYHNDQWFSYTPTNNDVAYLLIRNQRCRDLKGVQVVVLEGDPCKTTTYKLKKCIDFSDQADFFVVLDSLKSTEYLINVDGFLGDHCSFEISLSDSPFGLPVGSPFKNGYIGNLTQKDSIIALRWSVPYTPEQQSTEYVVYRKKRGDTRSIQVVYQAQNNALDARAKMYSLTDTLHEHGTFTYSVYRKENRGVSLIKQFFVEFENDLFHKMFSKYERAINFHLGASCEVEILLVGKNGSVLKREKRNYDGGLNSIRLDFRPFVKRDIKNFDVIIRGPFIDELRSFSFP